MSSVTAPRLTTTVFAALLTAVSWDAHAHHLDGVLNEFNTPSFVLDKFNGEWSTLDQHEDDDLALPGTGSLAFVENELSVYRVTATVNDTSGGLGDVSISWQATQGDFDSSIPFGIDNLIVSGIPFDQDGDADGVPDISDNCLQLSNVDQIDADGDNIGNACDADLNNDCTVSAEDLGLLRLPFLTGDAAADFNSDGAVNVVDLGIMREAFFSTPGPSGLNNACDFGA